MSQSVEARLSGLKSLADIEPPPALEAETLAAMAAVGEERYRVRFGQAAAWLALAVTGLLVAALALDRGDDSDKRSASAIEAGRDAAPEKADAFPKTVDESAYLALLEESNYLEEILASLPQRDVMRVSTAGTIAGLEQQIAQIDAVLWTADAQAIPPEYRFSLMRDRVETMNALVNVRYSQSRAFSY
jgi:hypothetical protein